MNRDSKTRGWQIGSSNNANAVRAEISWSCTEMAGKVEGCYKKKDLSKSRYEKNDAEIQDVMHTLESLQNPSTYYKKELINIASDLVAPSETKDILTAHEKGCNVSNQFVQQRLIWKQVEFSAPLRTMKMKTFCYLQKKDPHPKNMKETDCLKADKDLLTWLLIVRTRKVDIGEILTHFLSQFSSSLNNSDDFLQYTNKAALFHYLLAKFPNMKIKIPQNTALILDDMAINQLLADHIPATFGDLSIYIFRYIIKLASF